MNLNWSIDSTPEEWENGIKDEYGCLYTHDGKRLLKAFDDLVTYTVKEGVEDICDNAFAECSSLREIQLPDKLKRIGSSAFWSCNTMENIVLPDSIEVIESCVFSEESSLKSIELPKELKSISIHAFPLGVNYTSRSDRFIIEDDLLIDVENRELVGSIKDKKHVVVPPIIETIGRSAFGRHEMLEKVDLPNTITAIGERAFYNCTSLCKISLPTSLVSIGDGAFYGCRLSGTVVLPSSLTTIGIKAFSTGTKLKSLSKRIIVEDDFLIDTETECLLNYIGKSKNINIPNRIKRFRCWCFWGYYSFKSMSLPESLEELYFEEIMPNVENLTSKSERFIVIDGMIIDKNDGLLIQQVGAGKNIIVPPIVKTIGPYAFGCEIESIVIPNSVTAIEDCAFISCYSLRSVSLPDSLEYIGSEVFAYCELLQNIKLPNSLKHIGERAFVGCISIRDIVLPNSLNVLEKGIFQGCNSLKSIVLPNSITIIEEGAFSECYLLESIILSENLTTIKKFAFDGCDQLKSITLPGSIKFVDEFVFGMDPSIKQIFITKGKLEYFKTILDPRYHDLIKEVDYDAIEGKVEKLKKIGFKLEDIK